MGVLLAAMLLAQLPVLSPGQPAPAFEALADDGSTVRLSDFAGRTLVLFFYPKDETSGCTVEAQGFRDEAKTLADLGVAVAGISVDSVESHQAFKANHGLNYPLLTDPDRAIAKAFGVPVLFGFTARQTFVIGPDGAVQHVFRKVMPSSHAQQLVRLLRASKAREIKAAGAPVKGAQSKPAATKAAGE